MKLITVSNGFSKESFSFSKESFSFSKESAQFVLQMLDI
jgi:hypothetical protein